jgi:hypothetical protein
MTNARILLMRHAEKTEDSMEIRTSRRMARRERPSWQTSFMPRSRMTASQKLLR